MAVVFTTTPGMMFGSPWKLSGFMSWGFVREERLWFGGLKLCSWVFPEGLCVVGLGLSLSCLFFTSLPSGGGAASCCAV